MLLSLVTPPSAEPLELDEAKSHCRVTHNFEDALFTRWIAAAREFAETWTGRQLMPATWKLWLPDFWCGPYLELPRAPLSSVTSIAYYDGDNASQTWSSSNYLVLAPSGPKCRPGRVEIAYGQVFPTTYYRPDAVTVTWAAGYASATAVPSAIKAALLLLVAEMNERREEVVVGTSQSPNVLRAGDLLAPFIVRGLRSA